MIFRSLGFFGPFLWILAEIVTYSLVIQRFGIAIAMLIGIVSLALGFFVFRRLGIQMTSVAKTNISSPEKLFESLKGVGWAAFGGIMLIVPGFLSNLLGFGLLLLNAKAWLSPPALDVADDQTVDLSPGEWEAHDNPAKDNKPAKDKN